MDTVFNKKVHPDLPTESKIAGLKAYSQNNSCKDHRQLPYSQDEQQIDDMLFTDSDHSEMHSSDMFETETLNSR